MSNKGLGLDQLAAQMGAQPFSVDPQPEEPPVNNEPQDPPAEPQEPPAEPPASDPPKEDGEAPNVFNEPFEVSTATNNGDVDPQENQEPPAPNNTNDASLFAPFADVLREQGFLTPEALDGLEVNSIDDLVKATSNQIRTEVEAHVQAFKESLSPAGKNYLDLIEGGVNPDEAKLIVDVESTIESFTQETLSDVNTQKQAVEMYLNTLNMDEQDIKDQLEYLEDTGQLAAKAAGYANKLKDGIAQSKQAAKAEAEKQEQRQRQAAQDQVDALKKKVFETKEIIPNKPINDKLKEQLFASMTTAVGKDPNTGQPINAVWAKRAEDPISWEMKIHYLHALGVFDDKWDGIINSAKTSATKEFEKALQTTKPASGTSPNHAPAEVQDKTKDLLASFNTFKRQATNNNK